MRYAINFNLDYENNPPERVKALYRRLRDGFVAAGFRQDGRVFTIELPEQEACELARQVLEAVNQEGQFEHIYGYIKAFYGFDFEHAANLLVPPADNIDVEEMAEEIDIIDLSLPRSPD